MIRAKVKTSSSKPGSLVQLGVPVLCETVSRAVRTVSSLTTSPPSVLTKGALRDSRLRPRRPPPGQSWATQRPARVSAEIPNSHHFERAFTSGPQVVAGGVAHRGSGELPPAPAKRVVWLRLRRGRARAANGPVGNAPRRHRPDRAGAIADKPQSPARHRPRRLPPGPAQCR